MISENGIKGDAYAAPEARCDARLPFYYGLPGAGFELLNRALRPAGKRPDPELKAIRLHNAEAGYTSINIISLHEASGAVARRHATFYSPNYTTRLYTFKLKPYNIRKKYA